MQHTNTLPLRLAPLRGRSRASVPPSSIPTAPISAVSAVLTCSAPPTLTPEVIFSAAVPVTSLFILHAADTTLVPLPSAPDPTRIPTSTPTSTPTLIPTPGSAASDDSWGEFLIPDSDGEGPGYWGDEVEGNEGKRGEEVLDETASSDRGLSDPESDSGDEALGWTRSGSDGGSEEEEVVEEEGRGEKKEVEEESQILSAAEMAGRK